MREVVDDKVLGELAEGIVFEMIDPEESGGLLIFCYFPPILNQDPVCSCLYFLMYWSSESK